MTNTEAKNYLISNGHTNNDEMAGTIVSNIMETSSFSEYKPYNDMVIPDTTNPLYPNILEEVYNLIKGL